jgi:hypothetical protein
MERHRRNAFSGQDGRAVRHRWPSQSPQEVLEQAVPIVLRLLHAKQAKLLPGRKWRSALGEAEYLIESGDLRDFYGSVIGKIARSHGESMPWIHQELGITIGSLASHDGGEVDALKLACLLRAADAAHIDARRAPAFERALTKPKGVSDLHWGFRGKIAKPRAQGDALLHSSGSPFSVAKADAWWLCFDAIQATDRELRNVGEHGGHLTLGGAVNACVRPTRFPPRRLYWRSVLSRFSFTCNQVDCLT